MSVALFHKNTDQPPKKRWWNNQELAEFYRVSDIMAHAGLKVESESGVSDEGEPWFVFVRADTEEVIAHFAKIDGVFIAVSSVTQDIYRGSDVRDLINQLLERHPLMTPPSNNGRVVLHPRMVLVAFVAAAFVAASLAAVAGVSFFSLGCRLKLQSGSTSPGVFSSHGSAYVWC